MKEPLLADVTWLTAVLLTAIGLAALPALLWRDVTMRYLADFVPLMILLAFVGLCSLRRCYPWWRRGLGLFASLAVVASLLFGVLQGISGYFGHFQRHNPLLFVALSYAGGGGGEAHRNVLVIRIQEISPGLYEVNAADVQAVFDNAGQVLTGLRPTVQPSLSLQTGLQYRISSPMSDGVLTGQGFTVTAPKLAERAGLQVGDTILSVNGQPVTGFASLYGIIREVRGNPALSTVQVELDRRGTRLTKIFRIR